MFISSTNINKIIYHLTKLNFFLRFFSVVGCHLCSAQDKRRPDRLIKIPAPRHTQAHPGRRARVNKVIQTAKNFNIFFMCPKIVLSKCKYLSGSPAIALGLVTYCYLNADGRQGGGVKSTPKTAKNGQNGQKPVLEQRGPVLED